MNIIGIAFIATLVEGLVKYLFGDRPMRGHRRDWLKYVALGLGIVMAIAYQIDIPAMVGLSTSYGVVNYIVSGIIIGRGSNYVNDIVGNFKA